MSINTNEVTDILTPTGGNMGLNGIITVPKAASQGIKVDIASPTYPWADLLCQVNVRGASATDPTWNIFKGVMRAYQFTINDFVWTFVHLPHDYAPGTDLYFHAHYAYSDPSITTGAATWEFTSTYAKGHQQAAFGAEVTTTVTQTISTTQYFHHIAEAQLSTPGGSATLLDSNLLEPDGLVLIRTRLTGNTVNGGPEPFLFMADMHYQSTGIGTKNKAPSFYG